MRQHTEPQSVIPTLLAHAAGGSKISSSSRGRWPADVTVSDTQLREAAAGGLGPLLYHVLNDTHWPASVAAKDALRQVDLVAQLSHQNRSEVTCQLLDVCAHEAIPVTLLKGMFVSRHCYPEEHLRPMNDVDILVDGSHRSRLEGVMKSTDFRSATDYVHREVDAHGPPLLHVRRNVWIEVHTALFPSDSPLRANSLFNAASIDAHTREWAFSGRQALRLTDEFHLAYLASYWVRDIMNNRMHSSFVIPLLDAVYLLKQADSQFNWDSVLSALDNEFAVASVCLLLWLMNRYELAKIPSGVLAELQRRQRIVGRIETAVFSRMIERSMLRARPLMGKFGDRHPTIELAVLHVLLTPSSVPAKIAALPWTVLFPPWVENRYRPATHLRRMGRLFASRD